jgi:hypothetical protein
MKEKRIKIKDLIFDDHNANAGTPRGGALLENSLQKYGAGRSILLDRNNRIIAGNKTAEKAGELGFENVRIIETHGHEIIGVKRMDLDLAKGGAARELAIADNRVGEINLKWKQEEIDALMKTGVDMQSIGFDQEELFELAGDESQRIQEQEATLRPYRKVHFLVSIDVDKIDNIGDLMDKLRKINGVEIETAANG